MLRNYLRISLRNLLRHKGYAFINVAGLAVGLAVCLLILLFVRHELSYDRYHEDADRVYRMLIEDKTMGSFSWAMPEPVAPGLKAFPEVEQTVRVTGPVEEVLVTAGGVQGYEDGLLLAEPAFFEMFSFGAVEGNIATALTEPGSIVLTRSLAGKYFGGASPLGQSLTIDWYDTRTYTVKAVVEDVPTNSHLDFQMVGYRPEAEQKSWNYRFGPTYVLLQEGVRPEQLEGKLPTFVERSVQEHAGEGEFINNDDRQLHLQPLTEIHLQPDLNAASTKSGPMMYLYIFSGAALLILLIACVNYVNLATARSAQRAREVGVRKVVGAGRAQLVRQFLMESLLTSICALILALVLTELLLPVFSGIVGVDLSLYNFGSPSLVGWLVALVLLVGILSGGYPAFVLSGFQPAQVLKGHASRHGLGMGFRKALVVFQFAASVALILATITVQRQMNYVRMQRLNANDEQVVIVKNRSGELASGYEALKQALLARPGVVSVTTGQVPGSLSGFSTYSDSSGTVQRVNQMTVGYGYLQTLGVEVLAGRDFSETSEEIAQRPVIVNQAALRWLNLTDPVGQRVRRFNDGTVVGVVPDFHMLPLYETVDPLVIQLGTDRVQDLLVRLESGRTSEGLASIQEVWKAFVPDRPLHYQFLDERLDEAYRAELRLGRVFGAFGVVAVLIACLGLFGLVAFTAEQRTKEIGIRKVLGASVRDLVLLLTKDLVGLILIAVGAASPFAYFGMRRWLDDFAYRIEIGPEIFLLAGGLALLVALLTVSYQAMKAALADPVKSLRYE